VLRTYIIKTIIAISLIFVISGCSPKKYSFKVDAPPKYSSKHIFKSMNIKSFKSNRSGYDKTLLTMVRSGVAREGYIKIVNSGGDAILTATLNIGKVNSKLKKDSYECKKKRDGKKYKTTCYSYTYKKSHLLKVDYTLKNSRDNSVVFGESLSETFEDSWSSSSSASDAKMSAKSDEQIINDSLKTIADKIIKAITPHKETVSRELQEGDSDNIKLGITYVENGRVEQALAIWDQCTAKLKSPKDVAAAYYNIGVIKESRGEYSNAFNLYSKSNEILPKEELYIKAMTRAEELNRKVKKARVWKRK
jgi:tetratricopeptide (TPR) repeat protein